MCVCVLSLGTVERGRAPGRCLEPENVEPQGSMGTGVSTAEVIERSLPFMGGKIIKNPDCRITADDSCLILTRVTQAATNDCFPFD